MRSVYRVSVRAVSSMGHSVYARGTLARRELFSNADLRPRESSAWWVAREIALSGFHEAFEVEDFTPENSLFHVW